MIVVGLYTMTRLFILEIKFMPIIASLVSVMAMQYAVTTTGQWILFLMNTIEVVVESVITVNIIPQVINTTEQSAGLLWLLKSF